MSAILDGVAHASCNSQILKAGVGIELLERANDSSLTFDTMTAAQSPFTSQNQLFYIHLKLLHSLTGPRKVLRNSYIVIFTYSSIAQHGAGHSPHPRYVAHARSLPVLHQGTRTSNVPRLLSPAPDLRSITAAG